MLKYFCWNLTLLNIFFAHYNTRDLVTGGVMSWYLAATAVAVAAITLVCQVPAISGHTRDSGHLAVFFVKYAWPGLGPTPLSVVAMNPSPSYVGDGFMATNTHPRLPLHLCFVAEVEREAGMRNTLVCVSVLAQVRWAAINVTHRHGFYCLFYIKVMGVKLAWINWLHKECTKFPNSKKLEFLRLTIKKVSKGDWTTKIEDCTYDAR